MCYVTKSIFSMAKPPEKHNLKIQMLAGKGLDFCPKSRYLEKLPLVHAYKFFLYHFSSTKEDTHVPKKFLKLYLCYNIGSWLKSIKLYTLTT